MKNFVYGINQFSKRLYSKVSSIKENIKKDCSNFNSSDLYRRGNYNKWIDYRESKDFR